MAVRTSGSLAVAARQSLAVNALHEGVVDVGVALAAGGGNIELVDLRLDFVGGQNFVRTVAIGTHGGLLRTLLRGAPVHAFLVGEEGLGALAVRLHE